MKGETFNFIHLGGSERHTSGYYHDFFSEVVPRLENCYRIASESKDPSTQLGAVIYNRKGQIQGFGRNEFPDGVIESEARYANREVKYKLVQHAERSAICDCAMTARKTNNACLYCPWFACSECAKSIISSGIACVIGHYEMMMKSAEMNTGNWQESIRTAFGMFREADVSFYMYVGNIPYNGKILLHGQDFYPNGTK